MRRIVLAVSATLLLTSTLHAADGYSFHARVTDGRTGLQSNPELAKLAISPQQLEKAAKDRVIVLDSTTGTKWRWLMLSWFQDPKVEQGITDAGTMQLDKGADFAISAGPNDTLHVRCLRTECRFTAKSKDQQDTDATLTHGSAADLPLDSDISVSFTK